MTDKEIFEAIQQRFTDPKIMDLLRAGLVSKDEMEDAKRALRYGDAVMRNPILRDKLYKIFDRLLTVVKDDSTTRQMVKQDLRQLQKQSGDSAMSEDLNTANMEKAVKHDCAKHVVHETWGKGQCIPGEHTLLDDGTVTHYDVMFEHGIEQNVAVEDLTIVVFESHMHAKKKKAMEEEAVTPAGGQDSSKASKKGKPEMPMEKLKAIMEKRKSEAYKAMLRSQGKMEEEVEQVDEMDKTQDPPGRDGHEPWNFDLKGRLIKNHPVGSHAWHRQKSLDAYAKEFDALADKHKGDAAKATNANMRNFGKELAKRAKAAAALLRSGESKEYALKHYQGTLQKEEVEQVDEGILGGLVGSIIGGAHGGAPGAVSGALIGYGLGDTHSGAPKTMPSTIAGFKSTNTHSGAPKAMPSTIAGFKSTNQNQTVSRIKTKKKTSKK